MHAEQVEREMPPLLDTLVGEPCGWCDSGVLRANEFKGDSAVVCDDCGTPGARVW